jgi:hypothetical protein
MTALLTFHLSPPGELMAFCHSCNKRSPSGAERTLPEQFAFVLVTTKSDLMVLQIPSLHC